MRKLHILIVDDNRSSADTLSRLLRKSGDDVEPLYDGVTAIARMQQQPPDVVLTDLKMEPVDGMQVLEAARALRPPVEVIVFTAFGGVETAVRAMRMGARDFLTKPVSIEQVAARLDQIRASTPEELEPVDQFVARSPAASQLLDQLKRAADVPTPVWVEGEIGAGRSWAAHALHQLGNPDAQFVVCDLGRPITWPATGTVLLPGVDALPSDLQRDLVLALASVPQGVRLVATSLPDARRKVAEGQLRADLYYALAVVVAQVPPLRRRREDILPLFRRGLALFAERYHRPVPFVDMAMAEKLQVHSWPGNVRELMNLAERTVVMGAESFQLDVVAARPAEGEAGVPLDDGFNLAAHLEEVEKGNLEEALRRTGGDRNAAGRLLGVERNTLRYKLNKYGLLDR